MKSFCPFFKETCKGNECIMWKDESCLIVSFLQSVSEGAPTEEEIVTRGIGFREEELEVPDWIKTMTAEELAVEMLEFKRKEIPDDEYSRQYFGFHYVSGLFWSSKGIESTRSMPYEIRLKIDKAEMLAQNQIRMEEENQRKQQLEKEKEELPSLVSQCVDWARTHGFKRVTLADVDAYILGKNLDILHETRRALYAMTNVELKSRK